VGPVALEDASGCRIPQHTGLARRAEIRRRQIQARPRHTEFDRLPRSDEPGRIRHFQATERQQLPGSVLSSLALVRTGQNLCAETSAAATKLGRIGCATGRPIPFGGGSNRSNESEYLNAHGARGHTSYFARNSLLPHEVRGSPGTSPVWIRIRPMNTSRTRSPLIIRWNPLFL
jgi:hypothetical protein